MRPRGAVANIDELSGLEEQNIFGVWDNPPRMVKYTLLLVEGDNTIKVADHPRSPNEECWFDLKYWNVGEPISGPFRNDYLFLNYWDAYAYFLKLKAE